MYTDELKLMGLPRMLDKPVNLQKSFLIRKYMINL